ncbi:alpha/beta fold hydrolase [Candidatus Filomicrobium marinum]
MKMRGLKILLACLALGAVSPAAADPMLTGFAYPFPVKRFTFESQKQELSMAYMDVAPSGIGNGHTAVLLHGKNFCAATWESTIRALREAGFRVVAPDQVGFCKSTKPQRYQYGLHELAKNTHRLLEAIGVTNPIIIGHSMGGMLAFRYALMYRDEMSALVTVNPIGLEDWKAKGVPFVSIDELYAGELKKTDAQIKEYQRTTYYDGQWRPEFDRWVDMLAGMYQGEEGAAVAWNQALTSDMVFNQPVVYEFPNIRVPTLLLMGAKDNTAIGKARASEAVKAELGKYEKLGPRTAEAIPNSTLVMFDDLGHSPQVQEPEKFNQTLIENLEKILAQKEKSKTAK